MARLHPSAITRVLRARGLTVRSERRASGEIAVGTWGEGTAAAALEILRSAGYGVEEHPRNPQVLLVHGFATGPGDAPGEFSSDDSQSGDTSQHQHLNDIDETPVAVEHSGVQWPVGSRVRIGAGRQAATVIEVLATYRVQLASGGWMTVEERQIKDGTRP